MSLACYVLLAVGSWIAVLEALAKGGSKQSGVAVTAVLAVLSTALAVGAWYALTFVARPFGR